MPMTAIARVKAETPPGCTGVADTPPVCMGVAETPSNCNKVARTPTNRMNKGAG